MSNPTIGVAMSLYNQQAYVEEAIESLLDQTRQPDRIVVVDDGSSDAGPNLVRKYEKHGVVLTQVNRQGVSKVLNTAVDLTGTDFVAIQACDDVSEPERIEWELDVALGSQRPTVFALPTVIDQASRRMPDCFASEFFVASDHLDPLRRLFETGNWLCASSAFFSRDNFDRAGRFHPGLLHLQDFLLWIRLAHLGSIVELPERLVRYRRHSGGGNLSSAHNDPRMRAEMAYVFRVFFDGCPSERLVHAFPELSIDTPDSIENGLANLLMCHPDLIAKQAGIERALGLTELSTSEDHPPDLLADPFAFFERSDKSDIDRRIELQTIYKHLRQRMPWSLGGH